MRQLKLSTLKKSKNPTLLNFKEHQFIFKNDQPSKTVYEDLRRGVTLNKTSYKAHSLESAQQAVLAQLTPQQIRQLEASYVQDLMGNIPNMLESGLNPAWLKERDIDLFIQRNSFYHRSLNISASEKGVLATLHVIAPLTVHFYSDIERPGIQFNVECWLEYTLSDKGFQISRIILDGEHECAVARVMMGEFNWFVAEDINALGQQAQSVLNEFIELKRKLIDPKRYQVELKILQSIETLMPESYTQAYLDSLYALLREPVENWLEPSFLDRCDRTLKAAILHASVEYALEQCETQSYMTYLQYYNPKPDILTTLKMQLEGGRTSLVDLSGAQIRDLNKSLFDVLRPDIISTCFTERQRILVTMLHAQHVEKNYDGKVYRASKRALRYFQSQPYMPVRRLMEEFIEMLKSVCDDTTMTEDVSALILELNEIIKHPHKDYLGEQQDHFKGLSLLTRCAIYRALCKDLIHSLEGEIEQDDTLGLSDRAAKKSKKLELVRTLLAYVEQHHQLPAKPFLASLRRSYDTSAIEPGNWSKRVNELFSGSERVAPFGGPDRIEPVEHALPTPG